MKFVETHLTKHHLFHAPHRWFFAFLASPIHFAEMHYQKRYHLQFSHARKLFLFDMSLVATLIVIGAALLGWSTYNPTVTELVYLSVVPSKDRVLSGEYVTYTINYTNESSVRLADVRLSVELPDGFIVGAAEPKEQFESETQTFNLRTIGVGEEGSVSVAGRFYGTPNVEDHIHATIAYRQDGKNHVEEKVGPHIIFLRGSLLNASIDIQDKVIEDSHIPFSITLTNTGDEILRDIVFPLAPFQTIGVVEHVSTTEGLGDQHAWSVSELRPNVAVTLRGSLHISDTLPQSGYTIELAPAIIVQGKTIPQSVVKKTMTIGHPEVQITTAWDSAISSLKPGETGRLLVNIFNRGTVELSGGVIEVSFPRGTVNVSEAARANAGSIAQNTVTLNSVRHTNLRSIPSGESRVITLLVPVISTSDAGTNIVLQPTVRFKGNVLLAPEVSVEAVSVPESIKVGTDVTLVGEIRYYTDEGDQLGRGPLPPEVGKETKYAGLFTIRNTTSNVTEGIFTARLSPGVVWTGKTSVTQGSAPVYTPSTRTLRWNMGTISAHSNAGVFFELSLTPTEADRGTTPVLIQSVEISGWDSYIGYSFTRALGAFDASLNTDARGGAKGGTVR